MSRDYPGVFSGDAFKITCVSDTHFGRRAFTSGSMNHAGTSLDEMGDFTDLFAHVGDVIHWSDAGKMGEQDVEAVAWIESRKSATGKPWRVVGGNHDLRSYGTPNPSRSGEDFHAVYGGSPVSFVDHSDWLRIVFVTPEAQGYDELSATFTPMIIGADQVEEVFSLIDSVPERMVYVVFHAPLPSQFPSHMDASNIIDRLESATNVAGWISGHRHTNLLTDSLAFLNFRVKERLIHHINLPTFGGATPGYSDDRWGQPFVSTHISIFKSGEVELRFRDNMLNRWVRWGAGSGEYVTKLGSVQ